LLALGAGRGGQLSDPLRIPPLALGRVGFQQRLGLLQPGQPAGLAGQLGRELVISGRAVLVVVGLVGLGGLPQDLGDLHFERGQGAVGPVGGVGDHLGAVQRDHAQADQPGRRAQLQRLDQEASQGLLVADAEPRDGHVVGEPVAGQHPEREIPDAAPLDLPGRAHPDGVGVQQHAEQGVGCVKSFMQLAGTREANRREGRVDARRVGRPGQEWSAGRAGLANEA
jgi:hypothetical protein